MIREAVVEKFEKYWLKKNTLMCLYKKTRNKYI